jgi:hypothetical protein
MINLKKIIFIGMLLVPMASGYTQTNSEENETPITDPVLLEKLKQIDTMEKLLEITRSDSLTTGVLNQGREDKFINARDSQKKIT